MFSKSSDVGRCLDVQGYVHVHGVHILEPHVHGVHVLGPHVHGVHVLRPHAVWIHLQNGQQLPKPVKFDLPVQSGEMPSIKVNINSLVS